MKKIGCLLLLAFIIFSFNKEKATVGFINWYSLNKKQLIFTQQFDDLSYSLTYFPNELKLSKLILDDEINSRSQIKSWYAKHSNQAEFSLKISDVKGLNVLKAYSIDKEDYTNKQYYLIESISQNFKLVTDQDTVLPLHCSFENSYGNSPYAILYLVFPVKKETLFRELVFNDEIFSEQIIPFELNELNNLIIPKIK